MSEATKRRGSAAAWTLAGILLAGLALRLWGIRSGLPIVYNLDEYAHFTIQAVDMFGDGLNPNYFQNPPAYTYLLHTLYSIWFGVPPIGSTGAAIHRAFETDPTTIYTIARATSALMGIGAAWLMYFAGKRLYGTAAGLATAAFMCFTFLPVHYSHFALNDVPTLLPLALGIFGLAGIINKGRLLDYGIAGVGLGLATATKYTAAALCVAIAIAWLIRFFEDKERGKREFLYLLGAAGISLLAFLVANPYALLDADKFYYDVRRQADYTGNIEKLGTDDTNGWFYYAWTMWWGFGALPLILAVAGAAIALKKDWRRALPLVVFGLIVFLFMGKELRFYARWMMPIYPVLALFAGYGVIEIARWLTPKFARGGEGRSPVYAAVAVLAVALVFPLIHVVHNDQVLTRTDTRALAKDWLLENAPGEKIAIDLIGPRAYYEGLTIRPLPRGKEVELYAQNLSPARIDEFEAQGYCYVVSASIQKGRVTKFPEKFPDAVAYYKGLDERAEKVASFSPMKDGESLPRFNFDISYNYYPLGFYRPGPEIDIYRLSGGKCSPNEKT